MPVCVSAMSRRRAISACNARFAACNCRVFDSSFRTSASLYSIFRDSSGAEPCFGSAGGVVLAAAMTFSSRSRSSPGATNFCTNASAPMSRARRSSSRSVYVAVYTMKGMRFRAGSVFQCRNKVYPSMTGMSRSATMTSGGWRRAVANASVP